MLSNVTSTLSHKAAYVGKFNTIGNHCSSDKVQVNTQNLIAVIFCLLQTNHDQVQDFKHQGFNRTQSGSRNGSQESNLSSGKILNTKLNCTPLCNICWSDAEYF